MTDDRWDVMIQIAQVILKDMEAIKRLMGICDRSFANMEQMLKAWTQ